MMQETGGEMSLPSLSTKGFTSPHCTGTNVRLVKNWCKGWDLNPRTTKD